MLFQNRREAGQKLSQALSKYKNDDLAVIGIPRGGIVVAAEVAKALKAPLDVLIPRKIGAPHNPEVAIGAVTQDGTVIKDKAMVEILGVSDSHFQNLASQAREEISRRVSTYRGGRPGVKLRDKTAIIVDDGIATGYTIKAALQSARNSHPGKLILAVPLAPVDTVAKLESLVDEMICLHTPEPFYAVGQFYFDFDQTTDEEVIELLAESNAVIFH